MAKKPNKKLRRNILIGIIALAVIGIAFISLPQTIFGTQTHPAYVWSEAESRSSCDSNNRFCYNEVGVGYKSKINLKYVENHDQEKSIENNDNFIWDIGLRCSSERQGNIVVDKIELGKTYIPAQKRCDGTFDCNYGYDGQYLDFNLIDDKCFFKEQPVEYYRLITIEGQKPRCELTSVEPSQKLGIDYETLEECFNNLPEERQEELIEDETFQEELAEDKEVQETTTTTTTTTTQEKSTIPTYVYSIPIYLAIIIVALIVWQRRKKPRK